MGEGMSERMREAGQKGSEGEGDREGEEKEAGRLFCLPDFQEFQAEKEERGKERRGIIYSAEAEPFLGLPVK